jgi:hypothetical protein
MPFVSPPTPRLALLSLLLLTTGLAARAQSLGNSPYSRLGLGEPTYGAGLIRNQGMAGVGVASPNGAYVNDLNPALAWQTRSVTFDVGITGQLKDLKTSTQAQRTGNATLGYFAMGIPISSRWGATIGLRPLYTVDYENKSQIGVTGDPNGRVEVRSQGDGGIVQAYMAHGVRIAGGLSAGAEISYVFGSVESSTSTRLLTGTNAGESDERTVVLDRRRYGDITGRGGLAYRQALSENLNISAGAMLVFGQDLHVTRRRAQERRSVSQSDATIESLVLSDSVRSRTTVPYSLTGSLSIDNNRNRSLSLDVKYQPWTQFRADGVAQPFLADAWRVAIGGEWTPDPASVESYLKRMTYRVGVYNGQTGWRARSDAGAPGAALQDAGVTWGFALPLGKVVAFEAATVQTSFAYGQRGFNIDAANGVRESYLRAQIGISFSSTWFVKRRIE